MRILLVCLISITFAETAFCQGFLRNDDDIFHTSGVTINEVSARAATDFNADGETSTANDKDEFIEIINTSEVAIDVNGWEIADNNDVFTFANLQPIEPEHALIVFTRGADISNFDPGPGNQVISVTDLALHNEQDVVGIKNLQSVIVAVDWATSSREQFPSGWAVGLLAGYVAPLPTPWDTGRSKVRIPGTDYTWEDHPEVVGSFNWSVDGSVLMENPTASPGRTNEATALDVQPEELPVSAQLLPSYPNPFNPTTTVTYGLLAAAEVRITATDLLGRQVATLVAGDMKAAGYHTVQFNADGLASGTYLIRMEAGAFEATQQVVLLK